MSDKRLDAIEAKLETIIEKLHEVNIVLVENTQSLIIHEKRTDIAEHKLELLNSRINEMKDKEYTEFKELNLSIQEKFNSIEEKIAPVRNHVEVVEKILGILWKIVIPVITGVSALLVKLGLIKIGK